jgi:spore germination cell wall hydrolase CwlJ-like protein
MDPRELMARLMYGENRQVAPDEAMAIGSTVLNRMKLRGYPDDPAGVMLQPKQYNPLNPGDPNYEESMGFGPGHPRWQQYMQFAGNVLDGGAERLPYTHYFTGQRPDWAYSLPLQRIGKHWFATEERRPKTAAVQLAALTQ